MTKTTGTSDVAESVETLVELHSLTRGSPLADAIIKVIGEIDRLRHWKGEALAALSEWEDVYVSLGSPGEFGDSKAAAAKAEVERLKRDLESALEQCQGEDA